MRKKGSARRYARAVFELAMEKNELERWQTDLREITRVVSEAGFLAALENPKVRFEEKSRLLSERLGTVSSLALNLARLLIVKNKIGMMDEIADEYRHLVDVYHGIENANVVTAVPLDEKDKEKLAEKLGTMLGSKIIVASKVDPEILGGFIARIDGKLLDGSTRGKLVALKKELAG
jgi:F-type H+-transporting ATPase subunit delta